MERSASLDLSQIDPPVWRVLIADTAYGPYTLGQIQAFIAEGRIGLHSQVAEGDGAAFVSAETVTVLQPVLREALQSKQASANDSNGEPHNFLVISKLAAGDHKLTGVLNRLGHFGEALPGVFLLSSSVKLSAIQQALNRELDERDRVLIVDATTNRLGWFNLGPEADVHIRSIWDKKAENA